jgi:acyl-CoA thioesterase-1
MSAVALHFASGAAFFSGAACLLFGLLIVSCSRRKLLPPIGRLLILGGLFVIGMSATPLPLWAWCLWSVSLLFWTASRFAKVAGLLRIPWLLPGVKPTESTTAGPDGAECGERHAQRACYNGAARFSTVAPTVVTGVTLAAVLWELSWQLPPRGLQRAFGQARKPDLRERLVVIGDSLSAEDFTEGGDPWPTLLAREHAIEVVNLAFSGATARSAEKRLTPDDVAGALVLLEIGGNDVLGSTSPAEFERDLDRLLTKICRPDNAVVMLELPLPPLYNRFGEIQRRLASRHCVILIPKRYLASVLIGERATLDGLHLSPAGHQKMAEMIWQLFAKSQRS